MALPPRIPKVMSKHARKKREGMSRQHLTWIKTLPCCVCLGRTRDPHHLLENVDGLPKGVGRKNADKWAIPVCRLDHDQAHAAGNDEVYFRKRDIDARSLAQALWRVSGDTEAGLRLVYRAKRRMAA